VDTDLGPTHLDSRGNLAGWLCPLPHMTLATVRAQRAGLTSPAPQPGPREVTPVPPVPKRRHVPSPPPQLPY